MTTETETETGQKKSPLDQFLNLFAEVKAKEGRQLILLLLNIFAILTAYYILKPVREGLLAGGFFDLSSRATKIVVAGVSSGLLFIVVPIYSKLVDRFSRLKLLNLSMGFVLASLVLFFVLGQAEVRVGAAFYLWLSVVNVFLIAQFWSYANDLYTEEAGKRLFAVIAIGGSAGAIVGTEIVDAYKNYTFELLLAAAVLLGIASALYNLIERLTTSKAPGDASVTPDAPDLEPGNVAPASEKPDAPAKTGGISMVFKSKYLFLIASMIFLTNIVNTTGEFILNSAANSVAEEKHPDSEFAHIEDEDERKAAKGAKRGPIIGGFYARFFFWVNIVGFLLQAFVVSRIFKFIGVRAALFILPIIAFGGYALIGVIGTVLVIRVVKTGENATDYSLQNTVKQALFLPTTREEKYKAKAAIDTFFVRGGDLFAALIGLGGIALGFGLQSYALVNMGFVALWIFITVLIAREHKKIAED